LIPQAEYMIPSRFNVIILGGGPAGLATALSLRQANPALSVAVFEGSDYERVRIGETLPPTVRPLLEQLRIWDSFVKDGHLPAYATASAWGSDNLIDNEFIYHPHNRGWHLDRRRFDLMLAEHTVSQQVHLLTSASLLSCTRTNTQGWRVEIRTRSAERLSFEADFLVDASGRHSVLAHQQGARKIFFDRLLGLVAFYKVDTDCATPDSSTSIEACESGWWYSATLPDDRLVVAFMTDDDIAKSKQLRGMDRWCDFLQRTRHTHRRVGNAKPLDNPVFYPASTFRLDRFGDEGWLSVGDAASTIDPLSSHGIFKALRSGILASYAICELFKGNDGGIRKYQTLQGLEFEDYLQTRGEFYRQECRWTSSSFWERRHERITLRPSQLIKLHEGPGHTHQLERLNMYLSVAEFQLLGSLCRTPQLAHEIVSEFKAKRSRVIPSNANTSISDRRIVFAVQYLIDEGIFCVCDKMAEAPA
jgi:2-polyprenyl-6-methoxyphenol hydroxylase-like FAD-dependent oxidoreductase